jgi:hypothetical protein
VPSSAKRGKYKVFLSTVCVDEALRFPPQLDHSPTVRCFLYAYYENPYTCCEAELFCPASVQEVLVWN